MLTTMFLAHREQYDPIMSALSGEDISVYGQVSLAGFAPFFLVEYETIEGAFKHRDTVLLHDVAQVREVLAHDMITDPIIMLVSPARLNGSLSWAMNELEEIWIQGTGIRWGLSSVKYQLTDGRTFVDGQQKELTREEPWRPVLKPEQPIDMTTTSGAQHGND